MRYPCTLSVMATMQGPAVSLQQQVAEEVRVQLARRRMTGRQLAELMSWSPMYVSRRLSGKLPFTVADLEAISRVLKVRVIELMPSSLGDETVPSFIVSPQVRHGSLAGLAA